VPVSPRLASPEGREIGIDTVLIGQMTTCTCRKKSSASDHVANQMTSPVVFAAV